MGCRMRGIVFILSFIMLTVYMVITAAEDFKTCQVTRWKHLIGLMAALISMALGFNHYPGMDYILIFICMAVFILAGCAGAYGLADGFVLSNLTLFYGFIGGMAGIGVVLVLIIIASVSMLINHVIRAVVKKERIFVDRTAAFIPHLFVGYVAVMGMIFAL